MGLRAFCSGYQIAKFLTPALVSTEMNGGASALPASV